MVEAFTGQLPATTLQGIPVPILVGKMNDDFLTTRNQIRQHHSCADRDVATGIVRNARCVDLWLMRLLLRLLENALSVLLGDDATRDHQLDAGYKLIDLSKQM